MLIIGVSGKAKAGKDTFVEILRDKIVLFDTKRKINIQVIPFAKRLKEIAFQKFPEFKKNLEAKDEIGRKLLQFLGTDFYRDTVDENFWIKELKKQVNMYTDILLIPDCRFENEIDMLNNLDDPNLGDIGLHVHVNNNNVPLLEHKSEGRLVNYKIDIRLENNTTIDEFEKGAVEQVFNKIVLPHIKNVA